MTSKHAQFLSSSCSQSAAGAAQAPPPPQSSRGRSQPRVAPRLLHMFSVSSDEEDDIQEINNNNNSSPWLCLDKLILLFIFLRLSF